ncbi:MAG: hypothetical protein ACTSQJ_07010 [Promethearchaeota archaeon]
MSEEIKKITKSRYNPIEILKNMGWFSRLCLIGAILMLIDSLLELSTSPFGFIILIFSLIIILISPQMQDDNQYAYIYAIIVLILTYICHMHFHVFIGTDWVTGLGNLGQILINIGATLVLLFIILSVAASINQDPIRDIWLFFIGFGLIGINLLVYIFLIQNTILDFTTMLTILYFCVISICIILMFLGQKIIGGFFIWLISIVIFICSLFSLPLTTPVTGFGAGMAIVGNIAFLYFINELGFTLSKSKKE